MVEEINKEFYHSLKTILNMNGLNPNKPKEKSYDNEKIKVV